MNIRMLMTLLVAGFTSVAWAGGSAVIGSADQEQMRLEYSNQLVRMNMPGQTDTYMILRDGRMYNVMNQNGQPMVINMTGMMRRFGGMAQNQNLLGDDDLHRFVSLEPTGGSEQIAGVSGDVYEMAYIDSSGQQRTETLVLSDDARARELTDAFMNLSITMMNIMQIPQPEGREEFDNEIANHGLLRYGNAFRVIAFEEGEPEVSRFELPAEPTRLADIMRMGTAQGAASNQPASSGQANADGETQDRPGILGRVFGRQAERQQNRQESRAQRAADRASDNAVDRAVDRVFSIFD